MSDETFTPALGRLAPARFFDARLFDAVVALTRERLWRGLTIMHLAPKPEDAILDVGCGTGSLALLAARVEPQAKVAGLDPDPEILAVARGKDPDARVRWLTGMGDALVDSVGAESMDAVMSSLVLHQCPLAVKSAILESMFAVLRPGGRLVIADYGLQRTPLMRLTFRFVQFADGKTDTQPNADGVLPELISAAGFTDVREAEVVPTITGSLSIYVARKP
ncbi:class I SAM-dependent methyltransferase [[Mycobacterium] nativiensis]|uniref:Methyltransferase domain-containing protein n=1 Tax=[Mycobacterium] nativiensis TaxID=2855503 RepID=A0ABU5Y2I9_9MYCO|nr:methyltransferase domain-containing protein [Mycolicibacter sp. MYC340]MEB3034434.1 methyltransferase domain-containing protein [Mycolicibacter sp. MYC340]